MHQKKLILWVIACLFFIGCQQDQDGQKPRSSNVIEDFEARKKQAIKDRIELNTIHQSQDGLVKTSDLEAQIKGDWESGIGVKLELKAFEFSLKDSLQNLGLRCQVYDTQFNLLAEQTLSCPNTAAILNKPMNFQLATGKLLDSLRRSQGLKKFTLFFSLVKASEEPILYFSIQYNYLVPPLYCLRLRLESLKANYISDRQSSISLTSGKSNEPDFSWEIEVFNKKKKLVYSNTRHLADNQSNHNYHNKSDAPEFYLVLPEQPNQVMFRIIERNVFKRSTEIGTWPLDLGAIPSDSLVSFSKDLSLTFKVKVLQNGFN